MKCLLDPTTKIKNIMTEKVEQKDSTLEILAVLALAGIGTFILFAISACNTPLSQSAW